VEEPTVLGPLMLSKRFVMVGDYLPRSPSLRSKLARKKGYGVSLFERLCKRFPEPSMVLVKQYTMNQPIMNLANQLGFNNILRQGKQ